MKEFFRDQRPHNGKTYDDYFNFICEDHNQLNENQLEGVDLNHFKATTINIQRMIRITKTYVPSEKIINLINKITQEQIWMILTEGWCGDSAQIVPAINQMVKYNPNIKLRFLFRDENLDIMDLYLVNGKARGIPRLVIFDNEGNELADWGPRPTNATEMVNKWRSENLDPDDWKKLLHLWYARDHRKSLEEDFELLLRDLVE